MADQSVIKRREIFFYFMSIERKKVGTDETPYSIETVIDVMSDMLSNLNEKSLAGKAYHHVAHKKYIWLHECIDMGNGNFNLVLMSGKYDQSREVIDTQSMADRGILMSPADAPKEKTHICIRHAPEHERFIVVLESNYFGINSGAIELYFNHFFDTHQISTNDNYSYRVLLSMMPSKDFLAEVARMKRISVLSITLDRQDLAANDFVRLAGLDELKDTVELRVKRKRSKNANIPIDIIREYYGNTGTSKKFKKLTVEGASQTGSSLRLDTATAQMKHSITVKTIPPTNEIDSAEFFEKSEAFIREMGGLT